MILHDNDDRREDIDSIIGDGLWSLEKGDASNGDTYVAISYSAGSEDEHAKAYGFETNNYGQRAYYVFESDAEALAWFDGIEVGPAF